MGLLLLGIALGSIGQYLERAVDCPMYALRHDRDGDGRVSPAEWDEFTCVDCHEQSFCADFHNVHAAITIDADEYADPNVRSDYVKVRLSVCASVPLCFKGSTCLPTSYTLDS